MTADGYAHPDFESVASTFRDQLRRTTGGAAVAVYHRGELVVDLWGGRRNDEGDPWRSDTLAMCFSTTKGLTSTALHILADRDLVDYDAPVATYWPEFAQAGKETITVRHLLSHSAGLHRIRSVIDGAYRMLDWDYMVDALARAAPAYVPGTATGYHALTYGWLVGEVVRRVSGKPLELFVQDEVATPLAADGLLLGCPETERHRVAPLRPIGHLTFGNRSARRAQKMVGAQVGRLASLVRFPLNPRRMINALAPRGVEDVLTSREVMDASIPAANGFFTARSLARLYAMIAGQGTLDGARLLSPATITEAGRIQSWRRDLVLVMRMRWRLGYHLVGTTNGVLRQAFGHFGFGGSGGWADPSRQLSLAMVCNRGSGTPIGDMRLLQLGAAVMESPRFNDGGARRAGEATSSRT
ncbi:MAG TPA: serine hydrolase domain-containing protein [Acidimicrobiales bacterium]|nr:serine hydrolase domain-containing protein [Acidimicrobiales bacterium]